MALSGLLKALIALTSLGDATLTGNTMIHRFRSFQRASAFKLTVSWILKNNIYGNVFDRRYYASLLADPNTDNDWGVEPGFSLAFAFFNDIRSFQTKYLLLQATAYYQGARASQKKEYYHPKIVGLASGQELGRVLMKMNSWILRLFIRLSDCTAGALTRWVSLTASCGLLYVGLVQSNRGLRNCIFKVICCCNSTVIIN